MQQKSSAALMDSPAGQRSGARWVVVHDAQRDQYQLPIALAESGQLERFVTDWYTPMDRPLWRRFATTPFGHGASGLNTRFRPGLPSSLVSDNKAGFLAGYAYRRLFGAPFRDEIEGAKTARHAASIANATGANVLATSYCAAAAFANLRPGARRVLFQIHPHPRYLRDLYRATMAVDETYAGLASEPEMVVSEPELADWERESSLADHVICASAFTRQSLVGSGIPRDRITVLPYGIDTSIFHFGRPKPGPFTALYVGQMVARKSLGMLLSVWKQMNRADARLVIAGGHVRDAAMIEPYAGVYEEVQRVSQRDLAPLYQSAGVFVLPALAEGFGHVYLEALACGTPIICTENTGGADLIREGESGWVIPAGNREALADRLAWCVDHRAALADMREAARAVAERHTWDLFRHRLREALSSIEER